MESHGYLTETPYTYEYFEAISPINLQVAAAYHGIRSKSVNSDFHYLELGCGHAVSLLINAALYPQAQFYGVDIIPEHIAFAKRLAEAAGLENVHLFQRDFADLERDEIPVCDYVVAHGVITWVNSDVHATMRDLVQQKLAPGGIFYVSYNAMPGWADKAPVREILSRFSDPRKEANERIQQSFHIANYMAEHGARYFEDNARAKDMLESLKDFDVHYLLHEYMNEHWQAFYFHEIYEFYQAIELSYVGVSDPMNEFTVKSLPEPLQKLVLSQKDKRLRESLLDFIYNRQFRQDLYWRGAAGFELSLSDTQTWPDLKVQTVKGVKLAEAVLQSDPSIEILLDAASEAPISYADLVADPRLKGKQIEVLFTQIQLLISQKAFYAYRQDSISEPLGALNRVLMRELHDKQKQVPLANPHNGLVGRINQNSAAYATALLDNDMSCEYAAKWLLSNHIVTLNNAAERDTLIASLEAVKKEDLPVLRYFGIRVE